MDRQTIEFLLALTNLPDDLSPESYDKIVEALEHFDRYKNPTEKLVFALDAFNTILRDGKSSEGLSFVDGLEDV